MRMNPRLRYVVGPDGSPLTMNNLPPAETTRWVVRRKAEVVFAVRGGLMSLLEACDRYRLSVDEFLRWDDCIAKHGIKGLRSTWAQQYRSEDADAA